MQPFLIICESWTQRALKPLEPAWPRHIHPTGNRMCLYYILPPLQRPRAQYKRSAMDTPGWLCNINSLNYKLPPFWTLDAWTRGPLLSRDVQIGTLVPSFSYPALFSHRGTCCYLADYIDASAFVSNRHPTFFLLWVVFTQRILFNVWKTVVFFIGSIIDKSLPCS